MKAKLRYVFEFFGLFSLLLGGSLLLADFIASTPFALAQTDTNNCKECAMQWIYLNDLYGYECQHGKDPNCPEDFRANPNAECWELNGNKNASNGKKCQCFDCTNNGECEGQFLVFRAWCGLLDKEDGTCSVDRVKLSGKFIFRYERKAKAPDGKGCVIGAGNGFTLKFWCGTGKKGSDKISCIEDTKQKNCKGYDDWEWIPALHEVTSLVVCKGFKGDIPKAPDD
jgi:hypothetical protein